jgi:hypothetical protein
MQIRSALEFVRKQWAALVGALLIIWGVTDGTLTFAERIQFFVEHKQTTALIVRYIWNPIVVLLGVYLIVLNERTRNDQMYRKGENEDLIALAWVSEGAVARAELDAHISKYRAHWARVQAFIDDPNNAWQGWGERTAGTHWRAHSTGIDLLFENIQRDAQRLVQYPWQHVQPTKPLAAPLVSHVPFDSIRQFYQSRWLEHRTRELEIQALLEYLKGKTKRAEYRVRGYLLH